MKYYARIGENEYEIEIDKDQVLVNGEAVTVDLKQSGVPELYSVLFGGRSYDMLIQSERFDYAVTFHGEQFQVQVEDERTRRLNTGRKAPTLPNGELAIKAPIPGLVVKVLVEKDAQITEGQPLVILEAMKMENEIVSPRDAVIAGVMITKGATVNAGDPLISLE